MIREERYLEAETYSAEEESDRDRLGACLMAFGRRVTDLAEEYVPKVKKRPICMARTLNNYAIDAPRPWRLTYP